MKRPRSDHAAEDPIGDESASRLSKRPTTDAQPTTKNLQVQEWLMACETVDEPNMSAPSIPSVVSTRRSNLQPRARARSASPTKAGGDSQYRVLNMSEANVLVDHLPDIPTAVEKIMAQIFGCARSDRRTALVKKLGVAYCDNSRELAKRNAGEKEWMSILYAEFLRPIGKSESNLLRLVASDKPWISALKPKNVFYDIINPALLPSIPQKRPADDSAADASFVTPVTNLSSVPQFKPPGSTDPSSVTSTPATGLSTPKPDINVGLDDVGINPRLRAVLRLMQNDGFLLSDPFQVQAGLRFPFLIVEGKGGVAGKNMFSAQNQAAVGAACALNILLDLQDLASRIASVKNPDANALDELDDGMVGPIVFTITTEGPLHEIWVHFKVKDTFHMSCHGAWRTTIPRHANEFIEELEAIIDWGKGTFMNEIMNTLTSIQDDILGGILTQLLEE